VSEGAVEQGAEADKVREGVCVRGPCSLAPVFSRPCKTTHPFLAALLVLAGCATGAQPIAPRPFELWRTGDDGLTLRFSETLGSALRASSHLTESRGRKSGTLIVSITDHVGWKRVGTRTRVSYRVQFTDQADRLVGASNGSCWEDELASCAAEVLKGAERASQRMP
jgi:hypothetical protein